ncbi:tautomerase family protein [Nonomuraea polychroma]|uniref:tautomerase family protein n=1 Tax=Nonomuraea polychroma TaxID=46176 RepID=UPI003D932B15
MPLVRVDLVEGHSPREVRSIADAIHGAIVSVLGIPERDRFQIISEHAASHLIAWDAGLGFDRTTGIVMIQITTQFGRTTETKQRLYHSISGALGALGIGGNDVWISYVENSPADWSFMNGQAPYVEGLLDVPGRQERST